MQLSVVTQNYEGILVSGLKCRTCDKDSYTFQVISLLVNGDDRSYRLNFIVDIPMVNASSDFPFSPGLQRSFRPDSVR